MSPYTTFRLAGSAALALVLAAAGPALSAAPDPVRITSIVRVSTSATGAEADGHSYDPAIAPDGRRVAFASEATNLTADPVGTAANIFVKSLDTGAVTLVTRSRTGEAANGRSWGPEFSPDGKTVAFVSEASNLVAGDVNGVADVFLADLKTGAIRRLSQRANGTQADGASDNVRFSPDGRFVVFNTRATNLLTRPTKGFDIVVRKTIRSGGVSCVSCTAGNTVVHGELPAYSADGKRVTFSTTAGGVLGPFPNLTRRMVYVKNLDTGRTALTSRGPQKLWGNYFESALSPDGKFVAFCSYEHSGIGGWYGGSCGVRDLRTHQVAYAGPYQSSDNPWGDDLAFTPDGKALLISNGGEVFLGFLDDKSTGVVTKSMSGEKAWGDGGVLSKDGRSIAYASGAAGLVADDTNEKVDVFLVTWTRK